MSMKYKQACGPCLYSLLTELIQWKVLYSFVRKLGKNGVFEACFVRNGPCNSLIHNTKKNSVMKLMYQCYVKTRCYEV